MFRNTAQTDFQSSCSHSGYDDTSHYLVLCCPTPYLRMARCRWFEEVLGDQKLSSDLLLTFMTVDFDIQLGMWTCGHDTSRQFGEQLLVHVENQSANWDSFVSSILFTCDDAPPLLVLVYVCSDARWCADTADCANSAFHLPWSC